MSVASASLACRAATAADLPAIVDIYGACVVQGDGVFDDACDDGEQAERYGALLASGMPFMVAFRQDRIVGFANAEPYHPGSGFAHCMRSSIFISPAYRSQGIGRQLLQSLLLACRNRRTRQVLSWVATDNQGATAVHRRLGYVVMGWHREACLTHGQLRDVMLLRHDLWRHGAPPALPTDIGAEPETPAGGRYSPVLGGVLGGPNGGRGADGTARQAATQPHWDGPPAVVASRRIAR